MTFNHDYAYAMLMPRLLCSFAYGETLVNEIECIARNYIVNINRKEASISYTSIDYEENSIPLNTVEALNVLDGWFYKWIDIIRSIKRKTNRMIVDLTGGFDTRIIFSLILSSNIDLNSIRVFSIEDNNHTHIEDFEIASQIADGFDFKLNQPIDAKSINFDSMGKIINLSSYVKLGFSNQFNYKSSYFPNPVYVVNGYGGGCIRGYPPGSVYRSKGHLVRTAARYNLSLKEPVSRIIDSAIEKLSEAHSDGELQLRYYKETRLRNHFGKLSVEHYLVNRFTISPIIDPDLFKLEYTTDDCDDNMLLMTLILVRYCPKLLEFKVEGGRKFNPETVEYAKKINELKEFVPRNYEFITSVEETEIDDDSSDSDYIGGSQINNHLKEIFKSKNFKDDFKKYINPMLYEKISKSIDENTYFPLEDAMPAFSIVKVLSEISFYRHNNTDGVSQWLDSFLEEPYDDTQMALEIEQLVRRFNTARIDLKNVNSPDNSVEILEVSDLNSKIDAPEWYRDESGIGHVVQSSSNSIDLKVRCIESGVLTIRLRGLNANDRNNKKFPIYIDYTNFTLNGETIFDDHHLQCLEESYDYELEVNDSDILDLHVEWMPFNRSSIYVSKKIESLEKQVEEYRNRELKNRLKRTLKKMDKF